jgi:hypothetical protein
MAEEARRGLARALQIKLERSPLRGKLVLKALRGVRGQPTRRRIIGRKR